MPGYLNNGVPVVMSIAGDVFIDRCRILAVIWEGATISGNTCSLIDRITSDLLWAGRTDADQTYLGANFSGEGIHCPNGFKLSQISAGRVLVYLRSG